MRGADGKRLPLWLNTRTLTSHFCTFALCLFLLSQLTKAMCAQSLAPMSFSPSQLPSPGWAVSSPSWVSGSWPVNRGTEEMRLASCLSVMSVLHTRRYLLRSAALWQRKLIVFGWSALKAADGDNEGSISHPCSRRGG